MCVCVCIGSLLVLFLLCSESGLLTLPACCMAVIPGLAFAATWAALAISLLNEVSYLPRRHGCFLLVSPTVSLLPHFLMTFKAIPPEVFCETVCGILFKEIEICKSKIIFLLCIQWYVQVQDSRLETGNHFQFRIVMLCLWLVHSNAAYLQFDAFLITDL